MNKQEDQEFTEFLRSKAAEAKRAFGFPATKFWAMLGADSGFTTARKLLGRKVPSEGFTDLWEHGRLDLTVKAIVVETKWRTFFDETLIARAEALLRESKYAYKPFLSLVRDPASLQSVRNMAPSGTSDVVSFSSPSGASSAPTKNRRYWWVNQNQTYKTEVPGGFLWSPKFRADGARNQFYENKTG